MNSKNYFKGVFKQQMDQLATLLALACQDPTLAMSLSAMELPEGVMTEVKESSCHGVGLFAKKDISVGTPITIYPLHQYAVRVKDKTWEMKSVFNDEKPYGGYALDVDENTKICGCPSFRKNWMFNGHLLNDPVLSLEHSDINKFILSYILSSKARGNAKYKKYKKNKHIVDIVAVRDIKAGEELLVPYSLPYWFAIFGLDTDKTMADFQRYLESLPIPKHKFIVDLMFEVARIFD